MGLYVQTPARGTAQIIASTTETKEVRVFEQVESIQDLKIDHRVRKEYYLIDKRYWALQNIKKYIKIAVN